MTAFPRNWRKEVKTCLIPIYLYGVDKAHFVITFTTIWPWPLFSWRGQFLLRTIGSDRPVIRPWSKRGYMKLKSALLKVNVLLSSKHLSITASQICVQFMDALKRLFSSILYLVCSYRQFRQAAVLARTTTTFTNCQ